MEIEFIIPTYNRPNGLLTIIGSILQQTDARWKIHVVCDGYYDGYQRVKDFFSGNDKIRFSEIEGPNNDFGHTPRTYGLERATSEWVVMTGDDNYYVPTFVSDFLRAAEWNTESKLILCDMLHNHDIFRNGNLEVERYTYFESKPAVTYVDIGNFASKSEFAKTIQIQKMRYDADGVFVEEYVSKFCSENRSITKINKALYIHN